MAAECVFKPIDLDHGAEVDNMPDFMTQEMTEEDRRRWKKKSRKRRSQMRRKLQREANKTSSESGAELNTNEKETELEGYPMEASVLEEREQVKNFS